MIQRQLDSAKNDATGDRSDTSLAPLALDALPPPPSNDMPLVTKPGAALDRLGDYELLGEIARGGMGVVYKARQESLDRIVAVKMIRDSALARPEDVARFHSEATATARLNHPHIVAIHEVSTHQGRHFFSMDYIEGSSLAANAREKPLSPTQAATIVRKIAQAVQAAHDQGILHRDLKPSNVLIDTRGEPHVTDFGLAKRLEGGSELTGTAQVLGTPSYMPPEQALGQHAQVGFASDVYALGAILYELLAGRPPFRGETPVATVRQLLDSEPVSPRRLNPAVSADLETICLKCLEKEPAKRYATAQSLADELDRFTRGVPIQARPLAFHARAGRWCRRNPAPALVLLLLVTLAVGGPAIAVYTNTLLHRAQQAEQERMSAEDDRMLAQIEALRKAAPQAVLVILGDLQRQRDRIQPELAALWDDPGLPATEKTRISLFLLPAGPQYVQFAYDRLLEAESQEFGMLRDALVDHLAARVDDLWNIVASPDVPGRRLRAAATLAASDPAGDRWQQHAPWAADHLVNENPLTAGYWAIHFQPVKAALIPPLTEVYRSSAATQTAQRALATDLLGGYAADDPKLLVELLTTADARQFHVLFPRLESHAAMAVGALEQTLDQFLSAKPSDRADIAAANLAIALLRMDRADRCWPLLAHSPDPTRRSFVIHRLAPLGVDFRLLIKRLLIEPDASIRRALILAMGESTPQQWPGSSRNEPIEHLIELYRDDPDTGIHSAAEWVLRRWDQHDLLKENRLAATPRNPDARRGRYMTCQGQEMTVIDGPIELDQPVNSKPVKVRVPHSFAIATKEVTSAEFERFLASVDAPKKNTWVNRGWIRLFGPDPDCPHIGWRYYLAAQYCRWLSEQEGIPQGEMCFPPVGEIDSDEHPGMELPADYLARTGYRFPSETEWEFAARAGATTPRSFGRSDVLLGNYVWYVPNSSQRSWPVGLLKPNDFGLFDMLGNVREFCLPSKVAKDDLGILTVQEDTNCKIPPSQSSLMRGGSYNDQTGFITLTNAVHAVEVNSGNNLTGLRMVRTIRPSAN